MFPGSRAIVVISNFIRDAIVTTTAHNISRDLYTARVPAILIDLQPDKVCGLLYRKRRLCIITEILTLALKHTHAHTSSHTNLTVERQKQQISMEDGTLTLLIYWRYVDFTTMALY